MTWNEFKQTIEAKLTDEQMENVQLGHIDLNNMLDSESIIIEMDNMTEEIDIVDYIIRRKSE